MKICTSARAHSRRRYRFRGRFRRLILDAPAGTNLRPPPPPTSLSLSMPVGCRSETWLHTVKPPSSNLNPNYTRAWDADPRLYSRPSRIPSKSPAGCCPLAFLSLLHCCQGLTRRVHTFRQLPLAVATARATGSAERSRTLKKSEKRGLDLQADQTYADME